MRFLSLTVQEMPAETLPSTTATSCLVPMPPKLRAEASFADWITWLKANFEVIAQIIAALLGLASSDASSK